MVKNQEKLGVILVISTGSGARGHEKTGILGDSLLTWTHAVSHVTNIEGFKYPFRLSLEIIFLHNNRSLLTGSINQLMLEKPLHHLLDEESSYLGVNSSTHVVNQHTYNGSQLFLDT